MANKRKKLLIIDAHALIHRAFHALPSLTTPKGEVVGAVYGFTSVLIKTLKELNPDYVAAAFDLPGPTFRHLEYEKYKATRPEAPDELKEQFSKIREVVTAFGIPVFEKQEYEADDIIGTVTKKYLEKEKKKGELDVIILTGDLDTLQLVDDHTRVYTFRKGFSDTVMYDIEAVKKRFNLEPGQLVDFRGLKGDPSDNIPGVPGVGEKTAAQLIKEFGSIESLYKRLDVSSLPARTKEVLIRNKDQAFFSKKLTTIKTNLTFPFSLLRTEWHKHYNEEGLRSLFHSFGFYSLSKRIDDFGQYKKDETGNEADSILNESAHEPSREEISSFFKKHTNVILDFVFDDGGEKRVYIAGRGQVISLDIASEKAKDLFLNRDIKKTVYDLKNILKKLWARNLDLIGVESDLMIAAYILSPGERDYSVERIGFLHLGADHQKKTRVETLVALKSVLEKKLADANLANVFQNIEMPLITILAKMERAGILLDARKFKTLAKYASSRLSSLAKKIYKVSGDQFNINSPRDLRFVLFEKLAILPQGLRKTPTGLISTSAEDLETINSSHPIIKLILKYRELFKLKSTYIDVLPKLVDTDTGRIHSTFHQTETATGRLSSSNPNLQNVPVRGSLAKEIRKAFIASSGYIFASFDYSQIELRIIAHLSGDEKLKEAFAAGEDIHAFTASQVYGIKISRVTKKMRETAKALNFGIMYGISASRFARTSGMDIKDARTFLRNYFQHFEGVACYIEDAKEKAYDLGYAKTLLGRRRYLPEIYSSSHELRAQAERMAVNMPAQGTNADFIKMAMIKIEKFLASKSIDAHMILQIHDDLLFEINRGILEETVHQIKHIMESVYALSVPLKADVKVGNNWGNMVKYK